MAPPVPEVASESEIEAALAEAEAHADTIPNLDEGEGHKVVHLPFERAAPPPEPLQAVVVEDTPPAEPAPAASPAPEPPRPLSNSFARGAVRAVDVLLSAVNRPFAWLPSRARQFVGLAAIATLVTSLSALSRS